ncbi:MAG TPA: fluoride efflux transporter CrcB [Aequorivita sp.]|uniref:Fluoride-specific ion channel FluC n=1 Tax=Aequorivita aquimaris TaxID=1548749 RepID=A0A137RGW5_9FLAO|nr:MULTISPECIES: fluoride efflux transporter CrcB [Aequorivita]KXN98732.1 protein CrcB [Aequorivita aquimaris]MDC8000679.1 fluoride efflux transporter CrcB [Aequorivita todarodis]HAV54722.1 fluoride efflux transporter CrcB [Aequorivita sp.]HBL79974.1 fluoride efflux transporter CrcB [Aequorivita sp.]
MKQLALVFLGGGLGSVLRYFFSKFLNNPETGIPFGTFAANILGSLLIGIILGLALKNETLSQNTVLFLATGFCGGFTTFSTFAYENHLFLRSGDFMSFAFYTIASFVVGFAMVFFGMWLVKYF